MALDIQSLIDGLDGICYLIEPSGSIAAVGRTNWQQFAVANGAEDLDGGAGLIGRNLFEFIEGAAVRQSYRRLLEGIVSGHRSRVVVDYQCDSPTLARHYRQSISPLGRGPVRHLLVQNITVGEWPRPALGLYDFAAHSGRASRRQLPIVAMCSYCQLVRYPADSTDETGQWVAAETYYHRGGGSSVQISHGLCPDCFEDLDRALDAEAAAGEVVANLSRNARVAGHAMI